jgi:hypothetical protein
MTKKLEEILNLPTFTDEDSPTVEEAKVFIEENREMIAQVDTAIDKLDAAMPSVRALDASDDEMDELAAYAKSKAEDMMDLGLNVDPRFAGVILQTASSMLGMAITAKTAKIDRKLRTLQLQMQKAKLDHQIAKDNAKGEGGTATPVEGKGIVLDRNELLKQILNNQSTQK